MSCTQRTSLKRNTNNKTGFNWNLFVSKILRNLRKALDFGILSNYLIKVQPLNSANNYFKGYWINKLRVIIKLRNMLGTLNGYLDESWWWDVSHKSPDVMLSQNQHAAYFHIDPIQGSVGTAGVRGSKGFRDGEHYWEIHFLEPAWGTSVMIGVGTRKAALHLADDQFVDLLGMDSNSWGLSYKGTLWHDGMCQQYTPKFYEANTVIGVNLNMYEGTLTYYKDGKNLGTAFRGLNEIGEPLFPLISSTAEDTELEVRHQSCRYLSLEEKCKVVIAKTLKQDSDVNSLPLPPVFRKQISDLV